MEKKLTKIEVTTLPNGYSLTFGGDEYMYFSEVDLLAGFIAHVGTHETKIMERETIINTLFSLVMGCDYAKSVDNMRSNVARLSGDYDAAINKMRRSADDAINIQATITSMKGGMDQMTDTFRTLTDEYRQMDKEVRVAKGTISRLSKALEMAEKLLGKNDRKLLLQSSGSTQDEAPASDGESPSVAPSAGSASKSKRAGRRAKNDEAILSQIREKAKNNPNIM